jgi:phage terminase large subunit GpA-like protein
MPGKQGQVIPGGMTLLLLNVDEFKDAVHYRLQVNIGEQGSLTFHIETGEDFARQILGEEKRRNRKGLWEWVQTGANHLLDASVIAIAMGDQACMGGIHVLSKPQCIKSSEMPKVEKRKIEREQPKSSNFLQSRYFDLNKKDWLGRW